MDKAYPDIFVQLDLLFIVLVSVKGVKPDVVEDEFLPNLLKQSQYQNENRTGGPELELECIHLLNSHTVSLCDY